MTARYIACRWDPASSRSGTVANRLLKQACARTPGSDVHGEEGLKILWRPGRSPSSRIHLLARNGGAVWGTVFRALRPGEPAEQIAQFTPAEETTIRASSGKVLMEKFWGRYCALIHDRDGRRSSFLRDPSGAMTAYHAVVGGVDVFFSHPEEATLFEELDWGIDWGYVVRRLVHNRMQNSGTGLETVCQINAGECVQIGPAGTDTHLYWDPRVIATTDIVDNRDEAAEQLRMTTRRCVAAWASCYGRVIHRLSGGLDSSIVLGCLAAERKPPHILCLNHVTPTAEGDELDYARCAADQWGCSLVDMKRNPRAVRLECAPSRSRSVSPPLWLAEIEVREHEARLAREFGADAFFGGRGGDNVFHTGRNLLVAADYLRSHRLDSGLLRVLRNAASLSKKSVWEVAGSAAVAAARRHAINPLAGKLLDVRLIPKSLVDSIRHEDLQHPWTRDARAVPPGKLEQLHALADCQNYYTPDDRADNVYPLVSQPLMELCLRIPTYVLCDGGRDRGLARHAFRDLVPAGILNRTSKGRTTGYLSQLVLANLRFLRGYLIEGVLASKGLLERDELNSYLTEAVLLREPGCARRIVECFGVEAWARAWMDSCTDTPREAELASDAPEGTPPHWVDAGRRYASKNAISRAQKSSSAEPVNPWP
jgi:asparagine synthase (glutamine-hydrolysing)